MIKTLLFVRNPVCSLRCSFKISLLLVGEHRPLLLYNIEHRGVTARALIRVPRRRPRKADSPLDNQRVQLYLVTQSGRNRGVHMSADATFFESGLQLLQGRGNLKCALGNMLPIVAQLAGSDGASLFIVDESEMVLKPS